ncbi:MAG: glycosyltransferase family 4 protein [Aquabacterium sp.]|nr:glycosyltransferase family 4 protein [Aquabacterium sp.]
MKIVHTILTPSFAGSERYAVELANAQAAAHRVTVVLHHDAAQERPDAIAHRLHPAVDRVLVGGFPMLAALRARQRINALAPDIVHAHLSWACKAAAGARKAGARIASLHIHYKPQQHARLDGLIAIAPWQLADVPADHGGLCCQIDNWTLAGDTDWTGRAQIRAELGLDAETFLVGALCRCEHSKGLDLLLRAWDACADAPAGAAACARLAIVGGGRDWARLRQAAPPEVVMPGFVAQPAAWMAAFDALVSPARAEPFGLSLLEGMASGLPLLATASAGARHLAPLIGRPLVPLDDVAALAAALRLLLQQRPPRQKRDLQAFSIDTRLPQIEAFYLRCLAHRRATAGA